MIINNFKCQVCGHEFHEPSYSYKIQEGQVIYLIRGRRMKCPNCSEEQISSLSKFDDIENITVNVGRFSSLSSEDKKKELRKRAQKHTEKNQEQIRHIDKNFTGSNYRKLGL